MKQINESKRAFDFNNRLIVLQKKLDCSEVSNVELFAPSRKMLMEIKDLKWVREGNKASKIPNSILIK